MDTAYIINLSAMICALVISAVLLAAATLGGETRERVYRWFSLSVLLNLLSVLCEFLIGLLMGNPGRAAHVLVRMGDYGSYVFAALLHITFALYLIEYLRTKTPVPWWPLYVIAGCSGMSILLATLAQFNHMYASFDAQNLYHQSHTYGIAYIFPLLSLAVLMAMVWRRRKSLSPRELVPLLLYGLAPVACFAVELWAGNLWLSYFGASLTLLVVYLNIQVELRRRLKEQEMELAQGRVAIMLSQIQPHFVFNTFSAIGQLCRGCPGAQEALSTFAEYLRVNMDSVSRKEPVPFAWELEHVRQYLWLEALRFEERLEVVYDIRADQFMLPMLTVQPLVENAVRHGLMKRREGGAVTIRAEAAARVYRVTVLDNGVGFAPGPLSAEDGKPTSLALVRMRLEALCGGTLTVRGAPGGGTEAVIEIPKGAEGAV